MTATSVLIVDDMPEVRQELRTVLILAGGAGSRGTSEEGLALGREATSRAPTADREQPFVIEIVGEAANGLEAIRQAGALQPDVVLMDLEMPVLDGYEAARRVKTVCLNCRVIALTVHDYEAARLKAIRAGMDDFIVKGTPVETLVQVISGHQDE